MNGKKASVKHRIETTKIAGLPSPINPVRQHRHRGSSKGGEGLERARAKKRRDKMKELARSEFAYTVKVKLPYMGMEDPQEVVGHINEMACRLRFITHEDRRGRSVMVRAEMTDAREVWARVVPSGMLQGPEKYLWGGLNREKS